MLQQYFPFISIKSMCNVRVTAHGNVPLVGSFSYRSSSGGGKFQL